MNVDTGRIHYVTDEEKERLERKHRTKFISLTVDQAEKLAKLKPLARKNYMRNRPCPCGARAKFKNCCWKNPAVVYMGERHPAH